MMKSSYIRKALLVGCLIQLFQQAAGINTGGYKLFQQAAGINTGGYKLFQRSAGINTGY
jgi:hypothetical protein